MKSHKMSRTLVGLLVAVVIISIPAFALALPPVLSPLTNPVDSTTEDPGAALVITFVEIDTGTPVSDPDTNWPGATGGYKVNAVANGTITINTLPWTPGDVVRLVDTVEWTPASDANGLLNAFRVQAIDALGEVSVAEEWAQVNVTPVNDAPTATAGGTLAYAENGPAAAIDATVTVADVDDINIEGATVQITGNYAGAEDVLGFVDILPITGSVLGDTLTLSGSDSLANYQAALRTVTYANSSDNPSTLARTVTWTVNDGTDNSAAVTSTITVAASNDAPTAGNETVATNEDTAKTFAAGDFSASYADIEGDAFAGIRLASIESAGDLEYGGTDVVGIEVIPVANIGQLVLTPDPDANGAGYASFGFEVYDGTDYSVASYTMTVDVTAVNDDPTFTTLAGPVDSVNEDVEVQISFANIAGQGDEADVDGTVDAFVVKSVSSGTLRIGNNAGSATPFAAGTNDQIAGSVEAYWTPDGDANGTLDAFTIVAMDNNGAESAIALTAQVTVSPVADIVADAAGTAEDTLVNIDVLFNDNFEGTPVVSVEAGDEPSNGTAVVQVDNTINYTPSADFNGADSFTYTVTSGGVTETALVNVTVNPVADIVADNPSTLEDTLVNIDVLFNDNFEGTPVVSVEAGDEPANGTAVVQVDNTVNYTPSADFNGADSFTYTVTSGGLTETALVNVTVNPVADIAADNPSTPEDTLVNIDVLFNDNFEGTPAVSVQPGDEPANGSVAVLVDNTINYTPSADFNGADSFTYTVTCGGLTETALVNVTVNPVADIVADTATTNEDSVNFRIDVLANDSFEGAPVVTIAPGDEPSNGNVIVWMDNTFYTPNADFNGSDSFTYTVTSAGLTETALVTVTVTAVSDITADAAGTAEDTLVNIDVLANDNFEGTPVVSVQPGDEPTNGTAVVQVDNTINYTPSADFNGADSFTYTVTSGGVTETALVNVTVNPVADIVADNPSTLEDTLVNIDVLFNDNFEGTPVVSVEAGDEPANGTAVVQVDNTVNYTPSADFNGADSFTYTMTSGGLTETALVNVTVNPVADIVADSPSTPEDTLVNIDVLVNDNFEGTPVVSVQPGDEPTNGSVAVLVNNTIDYTPNADFNGSDSFTYTVTSGGVTETALVNVTVNPVADIAADSPSTPEDTLVNIDVLFNDNFEGTPVVSVQPGDEPTNGSVAVLLDNTIDYKPNADFNGSDSFTYTVTSAGLTETALVTVTVTAVPDIAADAALTAEDTLANIKVLGNDNFEGTAVVSVVPGNDPADGVVAVLGDNTINYTPNADFNGSDSYIYTVTSGGVTETATVSLTVTPVADIAADVAGTVEDTLVNINVLFNDNFEGAPVVSVETGDEPANGTAVVLGDNTINYTPNADFNGSDSFTYTVTSGGVTETALVSVTVTGVSDITADAASTAEDTLVNINVLFNDNFEGTPVVSVQPSDEPANGSVSVLGDNTIDYTPNADWHGSDSFTYTVTSGGVTETALATVTVNPVADVVDDSDSANEETTRNIDVLGNDGFSGAASVGAVTQGANGTVAIIGGGAQVSYTPDADWHGTDTFTYTVSNGGADETATVTMTVNPVADVIDDSDSTNEDTAVTITVLANDTFEGTPDVTAVETGTSAANGTVTLNADDTVTYTPNADFNGTDTFDYTVTSASLTETATVTVTVNPIADITDDTPSTPEDTAVTITVLANDTFEGTPDVTAAETGTSAANGTVTLNVDDTVTYTPNADFNGTDTFDYTVTSGGVTETALVTVTVNGTSDIVNDSDSTNEDTAVTIAVLANDTFEGTPDVTAVETGASAANGTVTLNADDTVTYTPNADWNGTDSFDYTVTAGGVTETATVTVTVNPIADITDDTPSTPEDTAVTITALANDTFEGTPDVTAVETGTSAANGTVTLNADDTVTYTPNADWHGTDSFDYTVTAGGVTETATVTVTVNPVVDITDDTPSTPEDTSVTITVLANDTFEGTPDVTAVETGTSAANGTVTLNVDDTVTYTPNADWHGTDSFDYTVTSAGLTETATVTVTVNPVADVVDDSDSTNEDTSVTITVLANDTFEGTPDVTAVETGTSAANGTVTLNVDDTVTYTPNADWNGTETFDYTVTSGGVTETATVTVTVTAQGDIVADTATTPEDTAVIITVLSNETFENTPVVTAVESVDTAANGTVVINAGTTVTYTPNADWHGIDTFDYTVTSGGVTETATVTVTVNAVGDIVDDTPSTPEDTAVTITVLANDTFEGTPDVTAVETGTSAANGTVTLNADDTVTYTPNADWNGTDSFDYTVISAGLTETATVTVTVNAVADIVADSATVARGVPFTLDLMGGTGADNFEDPGASITSVTTPTANGGTVVITGTGTVEYTSDPVFSGLDTFDYTVTAGGVTETATVSVTVENIYKVTVNWIGTGDGTVTASAGTTCGVPPCVAPISPFNSWTPKSSSGDTGHSYEIWAKENDYISFTAAPGSLYGVNGSRFVQWGDGDLNATHADIIIGTSDIILDIVFSQMWQIDRSVTGEPGALNPITATPALPADPEVLDEGTTSADYTFSPVDGYFVNLIVDAVTEISSSFPVNRQFTNITADHTMEANMMINPKVTAAVLASDEDGLIHGSITPAPPPDGTSSHFYGDTPTFTISADDGWCVESVTVDGTEVWDNTGTTNYTTISSNNHTYQFDPLTRAGTNDYEITAVFRQPWVFTGTIYPFMAQAVWQGAGSWSLYDEDQGVWVAQSMDHLNTVTLPCDSRNFSFYVHDQSDWETVETGGTRVVGSVKFPITVSDDTDAEARYRPILTLLVDGNGTTSPVAAQAYDFQTTATVSATPNDPANYVFTNWRGDADGTVSTTDVYMDAPKTVTAVFSSKTNLDVDDDLDGKTENQGDCDDGDPNRAPGIAEVAGDGIDQDCNGVDLAAGLGTVCLPISDVPLDTELQAAPANIMFILDDSGSMNWEFMTPESQGRFDGESYLFDGHSTWSTLGSGGGDARQQWQSQWHEYNKMYYNPAVYYEPWPNKEALHDPDDPLRFPGTTSTARTDLSDTFYDLSIAGQGGSQVGSTDIIIDDLEQSGAAGTEIIIDDSVNSSGFTRNPSWRWNSSTWNSEKYGNSYYYTDRSSSQETGWTATWDFSGTTPVQTADTYDVYIWWPDSNTYWSDSADYKICNGDCSIPANVLATYNNVNQNTNGGQWNYFGQYTFGASQARVVLTHDVGSNSGTNDNRVVADAVKIVKVTSASLQRRFEILSGTWYEQSGHSESWNDPTHGRHFYDSTTGNDDNVWHTVRWYPYVDDGDPNHGSGNYQIYAWWRDINDYSNSMYYRICYNGGTCVDSRNYNQTNGGNLSGQWNLLETSLGTNTFMFTGASPENEYVELNWKPGDHGGDDVNADAIAFVKQGVVGPSAVTMANSHYYVRGSDDNIYLVNLSGNVGSGTLQRRFYLFAAANKAAPRDTVDSGELTEVTNVATLQSLGLMLTDDIIANISADVTAGDTTINVSGLGATVDTGAYFTIEGAPSTFYPVTGSTLSTITTSTALPAVTAPKGITLYRSPEQERRNFANWFSFYRARHLVAKAAVGSAISQIRGVQIGLYTIQKRIKQPMLKVKVGSHPDETNTLLNLLYGMTNSGGTPLRQALRDVGRYYDNDDTMSGNLEGDDATLTGNPWYANDQGGSCQQSFAILMSDGFWNGSSPSIGDIDQNKGAPFQDHPTNAGTTYSNTLADVAYKFWNDDIVNDLDNDVPTNYRDSNNRQHMVTYTVAFGVQGTLNPDDYDLFNPVSPTYPIWPDPFSCSNCQKQIDDMWHASVNGRGIFLSAEDPTTLVTSLTDVIQNVIARIGSGASVSINGEELHAGTVMFQSSYSSDGWTGDVKGYEVVTPTNQQAGEKVGDIRFDKPLWSASYKLGDILPKPNPDWTDDPDWNKTSWDTGRAIATYDPGNELGKRFRYSDLTTNQRAFLPGATAAEITEKVNYIRGDNSLEEDKIGGKYRRRFSKIGDIVHSSPLYQGYVDGSGDDYGVIYVGSNGGMLHAFYAGKTNGDAADQALRGKELFAYVPNLVYPRLNDLTRPASTHQFYVDGTPFVRDTGTQKMLIGGLGRGGKGVYALDVTDPLTHTEANAATWVLWEYPRDNTPQAQKDALGYTYARPFMVQSNDTDIGWVVLLGNGYDSKDQCPALFVLNAHTKIEGGVTIPAGSAVEIIKASTTATCTGDCNGLSEPLPVDVDGNSTVDYVYAGDLRGNIWKFDMTSDDHTEWRVFHETASGDIAPFFTATGPGNKIQPITITPSLMKHPESDKPGFMIVFGTGKYLHTDDMDPPLDPSYSTTQTIFGIWDYGDSHVSPDPTHPLKDRREYLGTLQRSGSGATETNTLSNLDTDISLQKQVEDFYQEVHFFSCPPADPADDPTTVSTTDVNDPAVSGCTEEFSRFLRVLSQKPVNWKTEPDTDPGQLLNPITTEANNVGWYFDLPHATDRERVIRNGLIRDGKYVVITSIPRSSPCSAGGDSILHEMDAATGGRLDTAQFDIDLDAAVTAGDLIEIDNPNYDPSDPTSQQKIIVAPTGIHFRKMMYPPVILRMPDEKTEMKYFSTAAGNISMVQEVAEQRGMFYWRER